MSYLKTIGVIILSSVLFACNSSDDDKDEAPRPEVVTITAKIGLVGNSESSPETEEGYPIIEFRDSSGYAHFLRTDSYKIEIIDSIDGFGEDYFLDITGNDSPEGSIINISEISEFSFSAQGDALVKISFVGEHTNEGAYKYYTAYGEQEIDRSLQTVRVELNNEDYNFVIFRTTDTESLSLLETNVNTVTFGAIRETCIMERGNEVCTQDPYLYNYITEDSIVEFVSYYGESFTKEIIIDSSNSPRVIDFGTISIDKESSNIIIKEPIFEPIELDPNAPAILSNGDLTGGSITSTNLDSGEVVVKGEGAEFWGYPETLFFKGDKTLNTYSVNLVVEEVELLVPNDVIANIYIEKLNEQGQIEKKAFSLQLTGNVGEVINNDTKNVEFATYNEFILAYGDWTVSSKADAGRLQTNFIVRFGDSAQDAKGSSWIIKEFSISLK